ncbi:MAG: hypothetical protein FI698_01665 [SAR202 cluster bacterium]|nr:hypothetical protein [SAR202 cluster bacterium]|tara:strand:- start:19130 stop:20308 length:1179 start_codon:yes stop_codon:yes gene_type:complete
MKSFNINRDLDEIFNHCIELMHQGHSVEDCVNLYDSQRIQLLPLLKAAQMTILTAQSHAPNKTVKIDTKRRFISAIRQTRPVHNITGHIEHAWYSPLKLWTFVKSIFITEKLDEIVNHCIALMQEGHSIEECLKLYESNRDGLAPLLEAVAISINAAQSYKSREPAKQATKARFLDAANKADASSKFPIPFTGRFFRPIAMPMAALVFFAVLVLGIGSIAAVYSENAIPGDSNYWIKRTKENVLLAVTRSDAEIAQTHARLASTRGEEMLKLIEQGRIAAAEGHLDSVIRHLDASAQHSGVSLTLNTVDAPLTKISVHTDDQLGLLKVTLRQGSEILRIENVPLNMENQFDATDRLDRIRYEFELAFRILIWAVDNSDQSDPFWINQSVATK